MKTVSVFNMLFVFLSRRGKPLCLPRYRVTTGGYPYLVLFKFFTLFLLGTSHLWAETPKNFDVLKMENGSMLEGVLISQDGLYIEIECTGGTFTLPASSVAKVIRANPGESMILMADHLFLRKQFDRAQNWAKRAQVYDEWKTRSSSLLIKIEEENRRLSAEKKTKEKQEIERIIKTKGIDEGIKALQTRHQNSDEAEYWGTMRSRLHILLSLESLDHLQIKEAERHLTLAEQYGADPEEWNRVKQKLDDMKRMNALHGRDYLIARFKKVQPKPKPDTGNFLADVQNAQKQGLKTPPMELLKLVDQYATVNELDPLLVWAMIDTESSWRVNVTSNKGAQGLMQLMPGTANDLEVSNPFNAEENIRGGTQYLRFLLKMFNNDVDTALAAYNMGPGRIERAKAMPNAGKQYIQKVKTRYAALKKQYG